MQCPRRLPLLAVVTINPLDVLGIRRQLGERSALRNVVEHMRDFSALILLKELCNTLADDKYCVLMM